jgi:methionyl-tRNA formyltransferase
MRIVLVGAVESSKVALEVLSQAGAAPDLVVTLPPDLGHRHSDFVDLAPTAAAAGADLFLASDINATATLEAVGAVKPDLCLVIGWSQICREKFRSIGTLGTLGFHPSCLPRLRGRGVIPWTILLGEQVTGSTLFWMDDGVDTGDILLQRPFPVTDTETAQSLYLKHMGTLSEMLPEAVTLIQAGAPPRIPQDHARATYCAKRTPDDGVIDWHEPASSILRMVRAVGDPYPGAFSFQDGERLTIREARSFAESWRYIGIAGQVQCYTAGGFAVRCGDGECIDVRAWHWSAGTRPRVHSKLGNAR